jgi:DNA polymerase V
MCNYFRQIMPCMVIWAISNEDSGAVTPNLEIYSIDEAFLNFDGLSIEDYHQYGIQMKNRVHKWVGIPVALALPKQSIIKSNNKIAKNSR